MRKQQHICWGECKTGVGSLLRDPDFFEIIFGQGEKYPEVDVLLLKQGEILGEADLFQELSQILQEYKILGLSHTDTQLDHTDMPKKM